MVFLDSTDASAAAAGIFGLLLGLLTLAIVLGLYFLPGIVATARHAKNVAPVWVIDFFLGWTLVGWVVALAMAFGETREDADRPRYIVQAVPLSSATPTASASAPATSPAPTPVANTQQLCRSCSQPSGAGNFCQNCGAPLATTV